MITLDVSQVEGLLMLFWGGGNQLTIPGFAFVYCPVIVVL